MSEEKLYILVVDDDAISNFVTVRHLKQFQALGHIQDFTNPVEALCFLQSENEASKKLPDFILLDINMPQLDGWSFLDKMHELKISTPQVFMLTSSIYPEDSERSKNYKLVSGFIVKPLDRIKIQTHLDIV